MGYHTPLTTCRSGDTWVAYKEFQELYPDENVNVLHVRAMSYNMEYSKKVGRFCYINLDFIHRHHAKLREIWLAAHEAYFEYIGKGYSEADLARELYAMHNDSNLHSWYVFINQDLFKLLDNRLLDLSVSDRLLKFYAFIKNKEENKNDTRRERRVA